jgi:type I restriction enzyme R subunit
VHRQGHGGAHVRQGAGALEGRDRRLKAALDPAQGDAREALIARIHLMQTTDMAVVVSQGQNEVEDLKAKGLDIVPHRQRMLKESLDEKFKDPRRPCGWSSSARCGSPASTCRPARPSTWTSRCGPHADADHRAGQPRGAGQESGLIVDYVGIFRALQSALATYAKPVIGGGGAARVGRSWTRLSWWRRCSPLLNEAAALPNSRGVTLETIAAAQGFERIGLIDDAVEAFLATEADKKHYLQLASRVARLFKAILPDPLANELAPLAVLVSYLGPRSRRWTEPPDISAVMGDVEPC